LTLGTGWRNLTLPSFTFNSMAYGRATAEPQHAAGEIATSTTISTTANAEVPQMNTSEAAYDELLTILESPCNEGISLVSLNRLIYALLCAITANIYFCRQDEATRIEMRAQMRFAYELLIGWLVRLNNGKCWVLPVVVLSIWLWKSRASRGVWAVGSRYRFLYSKGTVELLLTDLGKRVQDIGSYPPWASRSVALCVCDNCLVKFSTNYEGCRDNGDGSWDYLFINWFLRPIAASHVTAENFNPITDGEHGAALAPLELETNDFFLIVLLIVLLVSYSGI
jgi:hypothetical protein